MVFAYHMTYATGAYVARCRFLAKTNVMVADGRTLCDAPERAIDASITHTLLSLVAHVRGTRMSYICLGSGGWSRGNCPFFGWGRERVNPRGQRGSRCPVCPPRRVPKHRAKPRRLPLHEHGPGMWQSFRCFKPHRRVLKDIYCKGIFTLLIQVQYVDSWCARGVFFYTSEYDLPLKCIAEIYFSITGKYIVQIG